LIPKWRRAFGWPAVSFSTLIAGFWGFCGRIENFHAVWSIANLRKNLARMVGQCVCPRTLVLEPKVGLTGGFESFPTSRVLTVLVAFLAAAPGQPKGWPPREEALTP
jgi:hypothetical protein